MYDLYLAASRTAAPPQRSAFFLEEIPDCTKPGELKDES
jgi:hypothetical protein